ncbi:MAG: methyl-accepting chemotaxis protein [Sulfitobacter sp.]
MMNLSKRTWGGNTAALSKIGVKLPLLIGILLTGTILIMLVAYALLTQRVIERAADTKIDGVGALKTADVRSLLQIIDRDITMRAADPAVATALIALADGFDALDDPYEVLHRVYIDENPHPIGQKDLLVSADTGSSYGFIHAVYHPALDALQDSMSYYDVFLFDTEGNLVYSVFKEADFATNMLTGPYKSSGLAAAFRQAAELTAEDPSTFVDFSPYEPSGFAPAAFISRPVFNNDGKRLGVLAYQMPVDTLNASIRELSRLGDTADGFLVGADNLLRTDSLMSEENDILRTESNSQAVQRGFAGESGIIDYSGPGGEKLLAYFEPIDFLGTTWVSVIQQTHDEIYAGLPWALKRLLGISVVVLALALGLAALISRRLSRPIQRLAGSVQKVADGSYDTDIPETNRLDELGDLARAAEVFRGNSSQMAKLTQEQEAAAKQMAALSAEREATAEREKALAKEREEADHRTAQERETMMRNLGASFGGVVEAAIEGEFSKRVEAKFEDQILNELAQNINKLLSVVDQGLSATGEALGRVASGDLTRQMEGDFRGAFGHLKGSTNNMIAALKSLVGEISESGVTLVSSSSELRDTATVLSTQAEQNAASLEETSAAIEELSASIKQVSTNVTEASDSARLARETAESSGLIAAEAASSVANIAEGSKEIARVVSVINDIAFQINLLALNAGVEAARAGEAGRGFSVVASEVRQLAQRASEAAKEVDVVISRSDEAVSLGVTKVSAAQSSLSTIAESVVSISSGIEEIAAAVDEQVSVIGGINSAVGQIDQNTQRQAASFEEVTAASAVLASEANSLGQSTARFQTNDQGQSASSDQRRTA